MSSLLTGRRPQSFAVEEQWGAATVLLPCMPRELMGLPNRG
eukprot:COSAG04_NODE_2923_length_3380_cov_1.579092_4_plen_41_part_00